MKSSLKVAFKVLRQIPQNISLSHLKFLVWYSILVNSYERRKKNSFCNNIYKSVKKTLARFTIILIILVYSFISCPSIWFLLEFYSAILHLLHNLTSRVHWVETFPFITKIFNEARQKNPLRIVSSVMHGCNSTLIKCYHQSENHPNSIGFET